MGNSFKEILEEDRLKREAKKKEQALKRLTKLYKGDVEKAEEMYMQLNKGKIKKEQYIEKRKEGILCCPKCFSTNIHTDKKGFKVGKALTGVLFLGAVGGLAGASGANKLITTCLDCGKEFNPKIK